MFVDCLHGIHNGVSTILVRQLLHTTHTRNDRGDLGLNVADRMARASAVELDDVEDILIALSPTVKLGCRHHQALLGQMRGVQDVSRVFLVQVSHVDSASAEPDEPFTHVNRREYQRVQSMRTGPVGVVDDEYVTGLHAFFAEELNGVLHTNVIASSEDRDSRSVRNDVAVLVVKSDPIVMDLVHHGVVRRAAEIAGNLVGSCQHGVPDNLSSDCVYHVRPPRCLRPRRACQSQWRFLRTLRP